jgi:hypothetical protein
MMDFEHQDILDINPPTGYAGFEELFNRPAEHTNEDSGDILGQLAKFF